jgi:hypothetical protein
MDVSLSPRKLSASSTGQLNVTGVRNSNKAQIRLI